VAQVYRDRDQFASLVREVAAPDVGRMGIEILSFTIKGKTTTTYVPAYYALVCLFVCLPYALTEIDVTSHTPISCHRRWKVAQSERTNDNRQLPIHSILLFGGNRWNFIHIHFFLHSIDISDF
jgi:hypothetical protein